MKISFQHPIGLSPRLKRNEVWGLIRKSPPPPISPSSSCSRLSITPLSISNHTTFRSFVEPENSASTAGFSFPTLTPLRPLPLEEDAEDSLPFGSRRNPDFLTSQPVVANPQPHSYLQGTPRRISYLPHPRPCKTKTVLLCYCPTPTGTFFPPLPKLFETLP